MFEKLIQCFFFVVCLFVFVVFCLLSLLGVDREENENSGFFSLTQNCSKLKQTLSLVNENKVEQISEWSPRDKPHRTNINKPLIDS